MKKRLPVIGFFLMGGLVAFAQEDVKNDTAKAVNPNIGKVVNIIKVDQPPEIDGVIEPVWYEADSAEIAFQLAPYFGQPPLHRTVARILTTHDALYCLFVCYDEGDKVQAIKGSLDNISGDIVSLMLDTFGNAKTAYKFAVTASGVRADCWLLDDARNRDYTWDGIWFAETKLYDWGWAAEIKVPYKSIQYDNTLMAWGLDFDRYTPRNAEDLYWAEYEEASGQRISRFGRLQFNGFRPTVRGMHLELYPVGIVKGEYIGAGKYQIVPNLGIDVLYNPSPKLTFQLTANPDFAQIEADPFEFNISRYETYYSERRPFFTEGNEIFMAAGRQRNMGFYTPMELFYPRRIGRKLPDGTEVPIWAGTKAFGRIGQYEYGGFLAYTGETEYTLDGSTYVEKEAVFGSVRLSRRILGNSSVGMLFVGKHNADEDNGVLDVDGAFRGNTWQVAYQMAGSFRNTDWDVAGSTGFTMINDKMIMGVRGRYVGEKFDVDDVGFVPWKGTAQIVGLCGPRWYIEKGAVSAVSFYVGPVMSYEKTDDFVDAGGLIGFNMQFRPNWGFEIDYDLGKAEDLDTKYDFHELQLSSWFNFGGHAFLNVFGSYNKTYNFARGYMAFYTYGGTAFEWNVIPALEFGTSLFSYIEGNPEGTVEEITYNARPYLTVKPINDLAIRLYVDNVWTASRGKLDQVIGGLLFSYNFSPKSWIYFAINDVEYRPLDRLRVQNRAAVFKIKYLYYL